MTFSNERPQKAVSRKLLKDALLVLMEEKDYQDISISQLCERAGVSRKTFYRHYNRIDDILKQLLQEFAGQTAQMMMKEVVRKIVNFTIPYFEFMKAHLAFLQLLRKNDLLLQLMQCINEEIQCKLPTDQTGSPNLFFDWGFYVAFGIMWMLTLRWLEEGAVKSPEEMSEITNTVIAALVQGREYSMP